MEKIDMTEYLVQVFVTNEEVDKAVAVQNLISVLQTAAQLPGLDIDPAAVAESIFDLMGLDSADLRRKEALGAPAQAPGAPGPQIQTGPQGGDTGIPPIPSPQSIVQQANYPTR